MLQWQKSLRQGLHLQLATGVVVVVVEEDGVVVVEEDAETITEMAVVLVQTDITVVEIVNVHTKKKLSLSN